MRTIELVSAAECIHCIPEASRKRTVLQVILNWMQIARSRQDLTALTDNQLKDIGLTRQQVNQEARKPFWEGPNFH